MTDHIFWYPGISLEAIEKQAILKAFRHFRGNKTTTANSLGIAIRTLDAKLEKYDADARDQDDRRKADREKQEEFVRRSRGLPPKQKVLQVERGDGVEPSVEATAQRALSLREREEVQAMPLKSVGGGGKKRSS